jgi:hypothetical protein
VLNSISFISTSILLVGGSFIRIVAINIRPPTY